MRHLYYKWVGATFLAIFCLLSNNLVAQTVPNLSSGLEWNQWWNANTVDEIETQFNAGRRHEESNRGLTPSGVLGNLQLPSDFLTWDFKEQALFLLNAERDARNGVKYGSTTYTVLPWEGVEISLCSVSQGHADDMQENNFFGHTGSDGSSSYTRITGAFPSCTEGTSENIAWNSYGGSGFIGGVALAIYNFIYDDACCLWLHRVNCLKMSLSTNNYNGSSKFGMMGFGRSTGSNGDFFVMDYFDPKPESGSCTYNVTNFESGSSTGDCPSNITLTGNINSGTYQAIAATVSSAMVPTTNNVDIIASNSVTINPVFEVELGSELTIEIGSCNNANAKLSGPNAKWQLENPTFAGGDPEFRRSAVSGR